MAIDLQLKGQLKQSLDVLFQAYKATGMRIDHKNDDVSKFMELIPVERTGLASIEEEEVALRLSRHDKRIGRHGGGSQTPGDK